MAKSQFRHPANAMEMVQGLCDALAPSEPTVNVYRGLRGQAIPGQRLGMAWSTNPFYSLKYAIMGRGELYWANVPKSQVTSGVGDEAEVSFNRADPPGATKATPEQMESLKSHLTYTENTGPGGQIVSHPQNYEEVGKSIFRPGSMPAGGLGKEDLEIMGETIMGRPKPIEPLE